MKVIFKPILDLIESAVVSWIVTCGLIYLACLCFNLPMTLRIATGIWLCMALVRSIFNDVGKSKK